MAQPYYFSYWFPITFIVCKRKSKIYNTFFDKPARLWGYLKHESPPLLPSRNMTILFPNDLQNFTISSTTFEKYVQQ